MGAIYARLGMQGRLKGGILGAFIKEIAHVCILDHGTILSVLTVFPFIQSLFPLDPLGPAPF